MVELNCIGLACPGPVLKCKEEIEARGPETLTVIVDNEAARENVKRFVMTRGYETLNITREDNCFKLFFKKKTDGESSGLKEDDMSIYPCEISEKKPRDRQLVFITSYKIGEGDDELGKKLMLNFIKTLPEMGDSLWRIILLNGGVKLATEEGEIVETLKKLEKEGVSILVCGTCLDFFKLLDQKKVGETTNMLDVVTSLQMASKVIKI